MSKELGVAIIGPGSVSNEHINAYRQNPHTEVRGIVGVEHSQCDAKIWEWGLENCCAYTNVHEMLKDEAISVVSICTPHDLHAEQGIACAEAGRHILMEKPMAVDLKGVRFVDCILNDRESHCNVADAVKTHEICLAMEVSAHEGRPVALPL